MILRPTNVLRNIRKNNNKRIIALWGGSGSSKTISALQYLTLICMNDFSKPIISVIGESIPVLKRSVIRDWQIFVMQEFYNPAQFNRVDLTYYFDTGAIMQFIPADDPGRFHGPRQDYSLFDEAYNIKKTIFDQVEIRTRRKILLTWNPISPFWATDLEQRSDCAMIHSTYKDNPYLDSEIVRTLEMRALRDPDFYRVYVLGQYGTVQGLIFKQGEAWELVDDFPTDEKGKEIYQWKAYGLDFGFTIDPSSIVEVRYQDGTLWVREHLYKTGMTNDELSNELLKLNQDRELVIADSSEPKSIEEIRRQSVKIVGSLKGPDSVNFGIGLMKQLKMKVTKDSINLIKELRNYSYATDHHGEFLNKPNDSWNHSIDAIRGVVIYKRKYSGSGKYSVH
ncbi:hypothetical protein AMJ86_00860 [bacterium SM23_57]|nr:MAG: hypothetical protein AMJ86_00860 [bacterium SM23_57]